MLIDSFKEKVKELQNNGVKLADIARALSISPARLDRILKKGKKVLDAEVWERFKELYG